MFIFAEIFKALAMLVNGITTILYWMLFARIIISWFPVDPYSSVVQFLMQVTDPILEPLRKIPIRIGPMDFSPILAFILLVFVNRVLVTLLLSVAYKIQGGM
ncbi:MAG TPA: YggT family protein [Candidatus Omnitrophota bacterium]|jgi:YggT family protein|nr:MAG: YGGT family protein [Candidatus Omnitrophica bacterium ADurb.Bin314]HOE68450.1 YggT family protein [Candidatus Omnitrophota bacterium]HPW64938.1 YggT family protein [Candidatus Omnitrophota bacterium]HQB93756.1 YggT family protein [Candidatus Omnitrophota bacterium]